MNCLKKYPPALRREINNYLKLQKSQSRILQKLRKTETKAREVFEAAATKHQVAAQAILKHEQKDKTLQGMAIARMMGPAARYNINLPGLLLEINPLKTAAEIKPVTVEGGQDAPK